MNNYFIECIKYNTYSKEENYLKFINNLNKISEILNTDRIIISLHPSKIKIVEKNIKKCKIIKYYN